MDSDVADLQVWVADLRGLAPTELFRCDCAGAIRCDYHAVDWPLILSVVVEEFRAEYGDGPADLGDVMDTVVPRIEGRLLDHPDERAVARTIFVEPMLASPERWTNGQHRCQAAMDAGCNYTLFID